MSEFTEIEKFLSELARECIPPGCSTYLDPPRNLPMITAVSHNFITPDAPEKIRLFTIMLFNEDAIEVLFYQKTLNLLLGDPKLVPTIQSFLLKRVNEVKKEEDRVK